MLLDGWAEEQSLDVLVVGVIGEDGTEARAALRRLAGARGHHAASRRGPDRVAFIGRVPASRFGSPS